LGEKLLNNNIILLVVTAFSNTQYFFN